MILEKLALFEHRQGNRTKPKTAEEIARDAWTTICLTLEERASNASTSNKAKRDMRFASREIRASLAGRYDLIQASNLQRLDDSAIQAYYVAREHFANLLATHDELYRLCLENHPLKKRISPICSRIRLVLTASAKELKEIEKIVPKYDPKDGK